MPRFLLATTLAVAVCCACDGVARAACGDTIVDFDEQCDDGNVVAGDCCSETCRFEPSVYEKPCLHGRESEGFCWSRISGICDGGGVCRPTLPLGGLTPPGARLALRDLGGNTRDLISWRLRSPVRWCGIDPPNPTIGTTTAFCAWSWSPFVGLWQGTLDHLVYEKVFPVGEGWVLSRRGWRYEQRGDDGRLVVRLSRLARFDATGVHAQLPGPVDSTRYFDTALAFGLVSSSNIFPLHIGGGAPNEFDRFRAVVSPRCGG